MFMQKQTALTRQTRMVEMKCAHVQDEADHENPQTCCSPPVFHDHPHGSLRRNDHMSERGDQSICYKVPTFGEQNKPLVRVLVKGLGKVCQRFLFSDPCQRTTWLIKTSPKRIAPDPSPTCAARTDHPTSNVLDQTTECRSH
jgi:hypothetical protein